MLRQVRFWIVPLMALACLLTLVLSCADGRGQAPVASKGSAWKPSPRNPIITMGRQVQHLLWNDPSVLKEDDDYTMWLSGGDPRNLQRIVVDVYRATSSDGLDWTINPKPVLSPGKRGEWDDLRVETPSVIKVGDTYHLYYSGADEAGAKEAVYAIGHATSPDGVTWTKDPRNPILTQQRSDRHQWGFRGVGEPGVVYNPDDKTFYLYYVSMRFDREQPKTGHIGILLATSKDGSRFKDHADRSGQRKLILTRPVPNATPGAWFGYSTPSALIANDGRFHLFAAFIVAPEGPATARHVGIAHAVSDDGITFKVTEEQLLEAGRGDWKDLQVRSPTVVQDGGKLRMWFAGETQKPHFGAGIGYAERAEE